MTEEVRTIIRILSVVVIIASIIGIVNVMYLVSENKKLIKANTYLKSMFSVLFGDKAVTMLVNENNNSIAIVYTDGSHKIFNLKEVQDDKIS